MSDIRFACIHCGKQFKAPDRMANRQLACPKCGKQITVPAASDPMPAAAVHVAAQVTATHQSDASTATAGTPPAPPRIAASPPRDAAGTGVPYPWDTPPQVLERAESHRQRGSVQSSPCKVEEFLEGLLRWQVFKSIKEKARQGANLAELHVYPDLVGIVQRPEEIGCLARLIMFILPLQLALLIINLISNLVGLAVVAVIAIVVLSVPVVVFNSYLAGIACWIGFAVVVIGGKKLIEYLSEKNLERIAARARAEPRSSYAIKQMFKRAGWSRWRTGIGAGQTGAVMAERYWSKGDVVQLVRVDARRKLVKRSLLLVVMDDPIPASPGWSRIGAVLLFRRVFCPQRRIYVIDVEGGAAAADAAGQAVSRVLGIPVQQGKFGLLALHVEAAAIPIPIAPLPTAPRAAVSPSPPTRVDTGCSPPPPYPPAASVGPPPLAEGRQTVGPVPRPLPAKLTMPDKVQESKQPVVRVAPLPAGAASIAVKVFSAKAIVTVAVCAALVGGGWWLATRTAGKSVIEHVKSITGLGAGDKYGFVGTWQVVKVEPPEKKHFTEALGLDREPITIARISDHVEKGRLREGGEAVTVKVENEYAVTVTKDGEEAKSNAKLTGNRLEWGNPLLQGSTSFTRDGSYLKLTWQLTQVDKIEVWYEAVADVRDTKVTRNVALPEVKIAACNRFRVQTIQLPYRYAKYGYIDGSGRSVISPQYGNAWQFSEGRAFVLGDKDIRVCIDENGRKILETNKLHSHYAEGLCRIVKQLLSKSRPGSYDCLHGYVDVEGKMVIEQRFSDAEDFSEGLAAVRPAETNAKWGFIDRTGTFVISPRFSEKPGPFSEGLAAFPGDRKWGYIDKKGAVVIQPAYRSAQPFCCGLARVGVATGQAVIDKTGKVLLSPAPDFVGDFHDGMALVKAPGPKTRLYDGGPEMPSWKYGFMDNSLRMVVEPQYENAGQFAEGLAAVAVNGRWGYIDRTGKMAIPPQFRNAGEFHGGWAFVNDSAGTINTPWESDTGYIDRAGKYVWRFQNKQTSKKRP